MRVLVVGADGQVGSELVRLGAQPRSRGQLRVVGLGRRLLDLTRPETIVANLDEHRPGLVVNAAAHTAVDQAEAEREAAFAINATGPAWLAQACSERGIPLLHLSTDYVFDGTASEPIREDHPPAPLGVYGESKLAGERAVRAALGDHLILRISWVFSARGRNFVKTILRLAQEREELQVVADQHGCPTAAVDVAEAILTLCERLEEQGSLPWGTFHYCGTPPTTWHGFAEAIVEAARSDWALKVRRVRAITTAEFPTPAARPRYTVLCTHKATQVLGISAPAWQDSLELVLKDLRP
ncbi:MAG: dTDP-4-dehydrorhamnose reductase [Planctomycetota bacterium]